MKRFFYETVSRTGDMPVEHINNMGKRGFRLAHLIESGFTRVYFFEKEEEVGPEEIEFKT